MVWNVLANRVAEDSLQVLDVLDRHPQGLNLGESLAGRSGQGKTLPQLSEDFVAILHPCTLPFARRAFILLSLSRIVKPPRPRSASSDHLAPFLVSSLKQNVVSWLLLLLQL